MFQYRDYVQWCIGQGLEVESKAILSFEDYAVRVIQSWWRHLAGIGQRKSSGDGVGVKRRVLDDSGAATVIQRAWRKHNVRLDQCIVYQVELSTQTFIGYQSLQVLQGFN